MRTDTKPGMRPSVLVAAVVLVAWEAVMLAVLSWTGIIGWIIDYYRSVLSGL